MSMLDDIYNIIVIGKCLFYQGGYDQSVGVGIIICDWWLN